MIDEEEREEAGDLELKIDASADDEVGVAALGWDSCGATDVVAAGGGDETDRIWGLVTEVMSGSLFSRHAGVIISLCLMMGIEKLLRISFHGTT